MTRSWLEKVPVIIKSVPIPNYNLVRLLFVRNSKLVASLCTTALEDHTTTTGLHASTETELPVTLNSTGLICPFH